MNRAERWCVFRADNIRPGHPWVVLGMINGHLTVAQFPTQSTAFAYAHASAREQANRTSP